MIWISSKAVFKKPERVVLLGVGGFIGAPLKRQVTLHVIPTLALLSVNVKLVDAGVAEVPSTLLRAFSVFGFCALKDGAARVYREAGDDQ